MLKNLDHIQLAIPPNGEAEARHFYVDILGFKELEKPAPLRQRGGCWFQSGMIKLHVGVEKKFRPAKKAHPAFETADIRQLATHLKNHNIPIKWDTALMPEIERFYTTDPFGNRLEFMQYR